MLARRRQASAWQDFTRDTKATIFAPLTPATDIADDPGEILAMWLWASASKRRMARTELKSPC